MATGCKVHGVLEKEVVKLRVSSWSKGICILCATFAVLVASFGHSTREAGH